MEPNCAMLDHALPVALYMDGALGGPFGKMGYGVLRYSPNPIVAVVDAGHAGQDSADVTGIPRTCPVVATLEEAHQLGAQVLILGIAPPGGAIPDEWWPVLDDAVTLGMSLVNGLHDRLAPRYPVLQAGQFVWDIRVEPAELGVGMGRAKDLPNRRVLMIGTDMAVGKMTAGLELWTCARRRGIAAAFIATGQIGITITGSGVPLDAIRLDFASGAIEQEVLKVAEAPLVIVEGQGSLLHPGSSANLPLLRGACPTHLVLCHRARMTHLARVPWVQVPPLGDLLRLYEDLAAGCGSFPRPVSSGICLNTSGLAEAEALAELAQLESEIGLPVVDPVRYEPGRLLDAIMA